MSSATPIRPPVPQPTGDTQYNVRDAALIGAASAFAKPKPKPKPEANLYTGVSGGDHGALLAASKVATGQHRAPIQHQAPSAPVSRDHTGRSSAAPSLSSKPSSSTLGVPEDKAAADRTPSPSNIAARLAAARHSPMPPPKDRLDDTPVPPTASLVRMFEQKRAAPPASPTPAAEPLTVVKRSPPPIRSPKPQRAIPIPQEPVQHGPPPTQPKPKAKPTPKPKPRTLSMDGFGEDARSSLRPQPSFDRPLPKQKPPQLAQVGTTAVQPKPPPVKGPRQTRPKSEDLTRVKSVKRQFSSAKSVDSDDASFVSASEEPIHDEEPPKQRPELPPPRRSAKPQPEPVPTQVPPTAKPKPAPPPAQMPPKSSSVPPRPRSPHKSRSVARRGDRLSLPSVPAAEARTPSPGAEAVFSSNYQRQSAKQLTQHLTGESISNAIVGAALASARAPSRDPSRGPSPRPTSSPPPPPPTRRHHHHLHVSALHHDRSPSPQKPAPAKMRTTLRKEPSTSSDEDEMDKYKKKGSRVMGMRKKHPNKHHEGTRKRWRDSITERERKRYEGVWAANKGLFITDQSRGASSRASEASPSPDDPAQDVLNLVVREIWSRSRLPDSALEEIWDLVDSRGIRRLRRDEFVVGLWLVDQSLKGRKMPFKVSDSVWESVRGVGVRVKVRK